MIKITLRNVIIFSPTESAMKMNKKEESNSGSATKKSLRKKIPRIFKIILNKLRGVILFFVYNPSELKVLPFDFFSVTPLLVCSVMNKTW